MNLHRLPIVDHPLPTHRGASRHLLMISLDWTRPKDPRLPLAQASLVASLQAHNVGYSARSFPINQPSTTIANILEWIATQEARTKQEVDVCLGIYVWNERYVQSLIEQLQRREFGGRIILGGPQISYAGPGVEQHYPGADVFIRGFAELALPAVARTEFPMPIDGVHWAGLIDENRQARAEVAHLPSPYLTGVLDVAKNRKFLRWETQRNCPYKCSFCQHRSPEKRQRVDRFPLRRIEDEVRLFAHHEVSSIAVLDPVFNLGSHPQKVLEMFHRANFKGLLSVQAHFSALRPEFLDACEGLHIRPEFGLQTIHENEARAVDRLNKLEKVTWGVSELHRRRIPFEVSLIFGLPHQTLESFRASVNFCLESRVPVIKAFPLMLLRGTKLAEQKAQWGLIENDAPIPSVVASDSFSRGDWEQMAAISFALQQTEGEHPRSLEGLPIKRTLDTSTRWSPNAQVRR